MEKLCKRVRFYAMVLIWVLGVGTSPSFGQDLTPLWESLSEEDQEALRALVLYPEDIRVQILELCTQPELVVHLSQIQQRTQRQFQDLLADKDRETQAALYELARYPDLIATLTQGGKPSRKEIERWVEAYPEEVQEKAIEFGRPEYTALQAIDRLNQEFDQYVQELLVNYPQPLQEAVASLMSYPEVLNILEEQLSTAIIVGDYYTREPQKVLYLADSLHLDAARKNADELEAWKSELEENPEAREDLEAATKAYAEDVYGEEPPVYRSEDTEKEVHVYHHYRPYPYWVGYPWWYERPLWYPRPYWYDWGFYYSSNNVLIVFSLPSWRFVNWHFYYHRNHYHYPYLSHVYLMHYERFPRSYYASTIRIRQWRTAYSHSFSRDWLRNDGNRVHRLREYGRFEDNYQRYVARRPDGKTILSRSQYLNKNRRSYKSLHQAPVVRRPDGTRVRQEYDPVYQPRSPRTVTPDRRQVEPKKLPKRNPPTYRRSTSPDIRSTRPTTPKKLENAREYHRDQWNRVETRRRPTTTRPSRTPTTRQAKPSTRRTPTRTTPTRKKPTKRPPN